MCISTTDDLTILTVSDGNIGAGMDEQLPQQQSYCYLYPPVCSAGEWRKTELMFKSARKKKKKVDG